MLSPSSSLMISPREAGGGTRNGMGSLNPHPASSREPAPATVSSAGAVRYRECLRNTPPASAATSWTAAASSCRAATTPSSAPLAPATIASTASTAIFLPPLLLITTSMTAAPISHHHHHHHKQPPISLAVPEVFCSNSAAASGGAMTDSSSEELNAGAGPLQRPYPVPRKRFRTKFTAEQKERMLEFAERLGWRIQKQDEALGGWGQQAGPKGLDAQQ